MFRKHKQHICEWQAIAYVKNDINLHLYKANQRVRELHKPVKSYKGIDHTEIVGCYECEETGSGREYWVEYPCPTIQALDGDH